MAFDALEGKRRPAGAVGLPQKFTDLVAQIDFVGHPEQFAVPAQHAEKVAQIDTRHDCYWA
jgi:hypothetical protein